MTAVSLLNNYLPPLDIENDNDHHHLSDNMDHRGANHLDDVNKDKSSAYRDDAHNNDDNNQKNNNNNNNDNDDNVSNNNNNDEDVSYENLFSFGNSDQIFDDKKKFPCYQCGRSYSRKQALQRHINFECVDSVPIFECPICSKKFKRKDGLNRHLILLHKVCSKTTKRLME